MIEIRLRSYYDDMEIVRKSFDWKFNFKNISLRGKTCLIWDRISKFPRLQMSCKIIFLKFFPQADAISFLLISYFTIQPYSHYFGISSNWKLWNFLRIDKTSQKSISVKPKSFLYVNPDNLSCGVVKCSMKKVSKSISLLSTTNMKNIFSLLPTDDIIIDCNLEKVWKNSFVCVCPVAGLIVRV